jgi:raffinose synthase
VFYPLVDGVVRCSLEAGDGGWAIRLETGSQAVSWHDANVLLAARGPDLHALIERAARAVCEVLGTCETRDRKIFPEPLRRFGWCSWNAFYEDVTHGKIVGWMRQMAADDVLPKMVILDGGWQQQVDGMSSSLEADPAKFPEGLDGLVSDLRALGVGDVFAWQTYNGYWRGATPELLGEAGAEECAFRVPPQLEDRVCRNPDSATRDTMTASFYPPGLLDKPAVFPPGSLFSYYDRLHARLHAAGVSGVKIDAMTWIEALADGRGGRVAAMRDLVHSAEASCALHLADGLIHCSSCSNDFLYSSLRGAVVRTSGDFMPDDPASHADHILVNAMVSLWMVPFVVPDWDMFQSGHEAGLFHAAARAISGGPVYVADAPGQSDAALLRRLRLGDGSLPMCLGPALPTAGSVFGFDSQAGGVVEIFNRNSEGMVWGAFHCRADSGAASCRFAPHEIPGCGDGPVAVWFESGRRVTVFEPGDSREVVLGRLGFEVATFAPVRDGLAVLGAPRLFNPGGVVASSRRESGRTILQLRDSGEVVGWASSCPRVRVLEEEIPVAWDSASGEFRVAIPGAGPSTCLVECG